MSDINSPGMDAAISAAAAKAVYSGSAATGFAWMLSNEFIGLVGLGIALAGLVVQIIFKVREDRRQATEHKIRLSRIQKGER